MRLPSLACDFFHLTATEGHGTGESFAHFPVRKGDCLLADRGYSTALGIRHVAAAGAHVTVRVNPGAPVLRSAGGEAFDWPESLRSVRSAGAVRSWTAEAVAKEGRGVPGRVYALRKTDEAIRIAQEGLRQRAARKGKRLKPHDLEFAKYVIVFTTFPQRTSATRTFWSGTASGGKWNWYSNASSPWRSWGTCRSATPKTPRPGCTASCW